MFVRFKPWIYDRLAAILNNRTLSCHENRDPVRNFSAGFENPPHIGLLSCLHWLLPFQWRKWIQLTNYCGTVDLPALHYVSNALL